MARPKSARLLFITGTDTGVGKTVLTALLLAHLRHSGCHALALKPFCSGGRTDVRLLRAVQDRELTAEEINPFYFKEPVAPMVSARQHQRAVRLPQVLDHIRSMARRCQCLLIEGAGGLLVPLGEGFSVLDVIAGLRCEVVVVSRNKLGTINHTLLTARALLPHGPRLSGRPSSAPLSRTHASLRSVVLMPSRTEDASSRSNAAILAELLAPTPLVPLPFLGPHCRALAAVNANARKLKQSLAQVLG